MEGGCAGLPVPPFNAHGNENERSTAMGHEGRGQQVDVCLLVTHGGSCLVSAQSSVARACSLLCLYLQDG